MVPALCPHHAFVHCLYLCLQEASLGSVNHISKLVDKSSNVVIKLVFSRMQMDGWMDGWMDG